MRTTISAVYAAGVLSPLALAVSVLNRPSIAIIGNRMPMILVGETQQTKPSDAELTDDTLKLQPGEEVTHAVTFECGPKGDSFLFQEDINDASMTYLTKKPRPSYLSRSNFRSKFIENHRIPLTAGGFFWS